MSENQKFYQDYHELVELMKKSDHRYDFELVERAYLFAEEKHGDQRRASGIPYILHPTSVACILAELGMDSESIAAKSRSFSRLLIFTSFCLQSS